MRTSHSPDPYRLVGQRVSAKMLLRLYRRSNRPQSTKETPSSISRRSTMGPEATVSSLSLEDFLVM